MKMPGPLDRGAGIREGNADGTAMGRPAVAATDLGRSTTVQPLRSPPEQPNFSRDPFLPFRCTATGTAGADCLCSLQAALDRRGETQRAMTGLEATLKRRHRFSLNWPYLGAIAGGESAIDLQTLALRNINDAREFVREYGFDIDDPRALARIRRAHAEAIEFIAATFLSPEQRALIPAEVARPDNVLELLVHASRHAAQHELRRAWSCAVLKVMHCVFYIDNNLKLRYFPIVRKQVFESLDAVVRCDRGQYFLTDGEACLPLLHYEKKSNKGRRSILLKLLQKAEYVAADIYDHLGVRMTFDTRFECLLALQILQRAHVISAISLESQRTRNTLLDLAAAKEVFVKYRALLDRSHGYPTELLRQIDAEMAALAHTGGHAANPHSAATYQSLQITVRKMVRLPAGGADAELAAASAALAQPGDAIDDHALDDPGSFFFNYEIQMMDRASREQTLSGPASHGAYKRRQVDTARTRVLGPHLVEWLRTQRRPDSSEADEIRQALGAA